MIRFFPGSRHRSTGENFLSGFQSLARACDAINARIGHAVAWITLLIVVVQFVVVVMRYVFGIGSLNMQQSIVYMHAIIFLVAAGYALQRNVHVRIDIFYAKASTKQKARIDFFGTTLVLLPFCAIVWYGAWPYVVASWRTLEGAPEGVGLPAIFLLKTFILVYVALLAIQGFSMAVGAAYRIFEADDANGAGG